MLPWLGVVFWGLAAGQWLRVLASDRDPSRCSGELLAVLDVDSEHLAAFDDTDRMALERIVARFAGTRSLASA